ncbi:MAG: response regulator [Thermodesulfovibrio sp.]|nr:response regulator [Thermodesulfovibrio sp.]
MTDKSDLIKYFLIEADDCLNILIDGIEELELRGYKVETIENLFRATHTLKGSANLVNLNKIAKLSHKLEDLFEALIKGEIKYDSSHLSIIKNIANLIVVMINEVHESGSEKSDIKDKDINIIDAILSKKQLPQLKYDFTTYSVPQIIGKIRIEPKKFEDIFSSLNEVFYQKNRIKDKERELINIIEEISNSSKKLSKLVENLANIEVFPVNGGNQRILDSFSTGFDELEFDTNLEYQILLNKLKEITLDIKEGVKLLTIFSEVFSSFLKSFNRENTYLIDSIIETRMIPVGKLLHRISEAIKDKAKDLGKSVEVEIIGGEIKIDQSIIESLYEPILHILINSINHGIETSEERIKKGKEPKGQIKIKVESQGNGIVISIKDDGRGIDVEKVKELAINKGFLSLEHASFASKEEILSCIFSPGFSTAPKTDFISGRGMGLHIVENEITKLNGTIEVMSEIERETTFIIKLPQHLTISKLLIFRANELDFAVPVNFIEEVLPVENFSDLAERRVIYHRERNIPVKIFLEIFFSTIRDHQEGYLILFNFSGKRKALLVEEILGFEEAKIQCFGKFLEGLNHYLGYYISSKDIPRYVINPLKIFEEEFKIKKSSYDPIKSLPFKASILVVDESLSVRKTIQTLFESKNFKVYTARNGVEALDILKKNVINLVITELEIPIIHGYEIIKRIKKDGRFKDTPVIVLTSIGTDKHIEKALALGAEAYIVKPFDEKVIEKQVLNLLKRE